MATLSFSSAAKHLTANILLLLRLLPLLRLLRLLLVLLLLLLLLPLLLLLWLLLLLQLLLLLLSSSLSSLLCDWSGSPKTVVWILNHFTAAAERNAIWQTNAVTDILSGGFYDSSALLVARDPKPKTQYGKVSRTLYSLLLVSKWV